MRGRRLLALLAAAGLAAANALGLLASGYADVAEGRLDDPASPKTAAAARIAASLAPWSSRYAALQGWIFAETGHAGEALEAYAAALARAPADPLLWSEYSLALARLGRFDAPLEHAVARAQDMAPTSSAVQESSAELGLSQWQRGTPALRERWLASIRYVLDHNRLTLLQRARARGQVLTFCSDIAPKVGEGGWCRSVLPEEGDCRQGPGPCAPSR